MKSSGGEYPGTSIDELNASGIPYGKLVVGKPGTAKDAEGGQG